MNYKAKRLLFIIIAGLLVPTTAIAQTISKSPYSRFGTGLVTYSGFAQHSALGHSSVALRSDKSFTPLNPASYSSVYYSSFQAGTFLEQGTIKGEGDSRAAANASFRYLGLAIPFNEKSTWGGSFGVLPFSNIGYNLTDQKSDTVVGEYSDVRSGNGGVSRFYFGTGFNVSPKLSLGVNGYYNFGQLYRSAQLIYVQSSPLYNYIEDRTTNVNGLSYDFGLQYTFGAEGDTTGKKLKHTIGLTYNSGYTLNGSANTIARTFELLDGGTNQQFVLRDTVAFLEEVEGDIEMPGNFAFGYSFTRPEKFLFIMEYKQTNWADYRFYGVNDNLVNSQEYSIGYTKFGKLTNDDIDLTKYQKLRKNTHYSGGLRFTNTNLTLQGNNIQEIGINFGVGIPVRTRVVENDRVNTIFSRVNISAEYYTRGAGLDSEGLVSENYFMLTVGFNLNDKWFNKTKFY